MVRLSELSGYISLTLLIALCYVCGRFYLISPTFSSLSSVKTRWLLSQSPARKQYIVISGACVDSGSAGAT